MTSAKLQGIASQRQNWTLKEGSNLVKLKYCFQPLTPITGKERMQTCACSVRVSADIECRASVESTNIDVTGLLLTGTLFSKYPLVKPH